MGKMQTTLGTKVSLRVACPASSFCAESVGRTVQSFISAVAAIDMSRPSSVVGKLNFVRDALAQFSSDQACSTNQAAAYALLIAKVLKEDV